MLKFQDIHIMKTWL